MLDTQMHFDIRYLHGGNEAQGAGAMRNMFIVIGLLLGYFLGVMSERDRWHKAENERLFAENKVKADNLNKAASDLLQQTIKLQQEVEQMRKDVTKLADPKGREGGR